MITDEQSIQPPATPLAVTASNEAEQQESDDKPTAPPPTPPTPTISADQPEEEPAAVVAPNPAPQNPAFISKEQEMLSTIANMKQEVNTTTHPHQQQPLQSLPPPPQLQSLQQQPTGGIDYAAASKEVMYIKKEPGEDSMDNSNSNEPHDLKLKVEIKSEAKLNASVDAHDQDTKFEDDHMSAKPTSFEGHIKYGPSDHMICGLAPPPGGKFGDPMKYGPPDGMKYPQPDMQGSMKYPPPPPDMKYGDGVMKYDMKSYLEVPSTNKYHQQHSDGAMKPSYPESGPLKLSNDPQLLKAYQTEPADMKYNPNDHHKYTPPVGDQIKYENAESPHMAKHPYADAHQQQQQHQMRSPYDPPHHMKYGEPMHKFGLPAGAPQDFRPQQQPPEMKYRLQDGPIKSQFSADNLIKNPGGYMDQPQPPQSMKYPPVETHQIDSSSRSTPNQDSQGSNSNFPPSQQMHHPHASSLPSPQTRHGSPHQHNQSPHQQQSQPTPLIMSHPGLPSSLSGMPGGPPHLPSNHPSLLGSNASSSTTSLNPPLPSHMLPGVGPPSLLPPGLIGSNLLPPNNPSAPAGHPTLHRPHQDIPPSMHPHSMGAFSAGIPPSHPGSHNQSQSPVTMGGPPPPSARDNDRDRERMDRRDGPPVGGMPPHHRASPVTGMMPGGPGGPPPGLLGHPSIPMHLGGPGGPPVGMPLLSAHHPSHLGPPLLPPALPSSANNAPLPLISSHSTGSIGSHSDGRRTPTAASTQSIPPSPVGHPPTSSASAFSRTSPSVHFASLPPTSAHRTNSPSQPPNNLTRSSPLHLPQHQSSSSALSAAAAVAAERDRQAMMRQQSPHMTPPPPVSSASLIASPLSKMYGQQQQQQQQQRSIGASPPPHHLRPGASPPVMRHPQMPLPIPMIGQPGSMSNPMGMHPHNPYSLAHIHPMFYPHPQHNPFGSPYPYHPYGPGFQYMPRAPPPGASLDPSSIMSHHQSVSARCEETPTHVEKQMTISNSQSIQHKVIKTLTTHSC